MAKSIMVQGTMSNVGKSLLAAGLCRIFAQDGYKVVPFKAQNMALNSYITPDGLEMGRAQVVQAEAAGCEVDVRMNPILLKPTDEEGSQVVVNGRVMGNMRAADYYRQKQNLLPAVHAAYDGLAAENDIVVIEGAGSPAEINLKQNDLVNMYMAGYAKAPVLLVGDIDRGGVFASVYGTIMLLPPEERQRIKGVIINKFRGDVSLLTPGLSMLEEKIHCPVLGVVPYRPFAIDDEDSLSSRLTQNAAPKLLDIAVIRLPRLSNFTDFNAFERVEVASVRYISALKEWGDPDLVILPGTKNTMGDLRWLKQTGLAGAILRHTGAKKPLIGICGGYQMLCKELADPEGAEGGGKMAGLGILDATTTFAKQKVRTRVKGHFLQPQGIFSPLKGLPFTGYEIHMGHTQGATTPLGEISTNGAHYQPDGRTQGSVFGSYVHGLFDEPVVLRGITQALLQAKGIQITLPETSLLDPAVFKEKEYDRLAATVREALDMQAVYKIVQAGL